MGKCKDRKRFFPPVRSNDHDPTQCTTKTIAREAGEGCGRPSASHHFALNKRLPFVRDPFPECTFLLSPKRPNTHHPTSSAPAATAQPPNSDAAAAAGTAEWDLLSSVVLSSHTVHQPRYQQKRLQEINSNSPFSNSPHLLIVILLLSNSPSYSIPPFLTFPPPPSVFLVSPQLKSSNFQNA